MSTNISLRTRDIKWYDINVKWQSNYGLLRNDTLSVSNVSVANIATVNRFVNEANATLNTYFNDGVSATPNVTISNNEGRISKLPSNITLAFSNTTFGYNIMDPNGNITYKAYNSSTGLVEIYHGGNSDAYSYGVSGTTVPVAHGGGGANYQGSLQIISSNTAAETGTIVYDDVSNNQYLFATDTTGAISRDKIIVEYKQAKDRLDEDLIYTINDVFKYADGYTDNRKVKVAPVDSDGDMVPDKPFQFNEFVSVDDLIIFENYTDFDGYTYDRPVKGVIIDYRGDDVDISAAAGSPGTISPVSYTDPVEWSTINYILVDTLLIAEKFNNTATQFSGIHIYVAENEKFYTMTPSSTDATNIQLVEDTNYFVKVGRGASQNTRDVEERPCIIKWDHNAPNDIRIDPSISNIVEMQVLTASYYSEIQKYIKVPGTEFPVPPTSGELSNEFVKLNEFKGASDTIVYKSAKFKRLFGTDSEEDVQAKFKVVKLSGTTLSDNEIKTKIIQAFNNYFDVSNWEFGENFYFTELSSYVHQQLSGIIGSIVICPKNTSGIFGDLFQIKAESNELFISTAKVTDIEIIDKITNTTLSNY